MKADEFNRYTPYYDLKEERITMSHVYDGEWVRVTEVCELVKERDEARAEVKRLRDYNARQWSREAERARAMSRAMFEPGLNHAAEDLQKELKEAQAEVGRLVRLHDDVERYWQEAEERLKTVAERQREACAEVAAVYDGTKELYQMVCATPLVTEGSK